MRLKHLETSLSCLQREFPDPKVELEQYPTSPELAACVVDTAVNRGDLGNPGQSCLDLGCGTGMLTVAAAFCVEEGEIVWGVDCDDDALTIARENVEHVEMDDCVRFVRAEIKMKPKPPGDVDGSRQQSKQRGGRGRKGGRGRGGARGGGGGRVGSQPASLTKSRLIYGKEDGVPLEDNCVETVLTNPPFGTKSDKAGIDVQFLRTATRLARRAVYSFHKKSTRNFLLKLIREDWGFPESEVVAEMRFDIPKSYNFHKSKSKDVEVDLIRIFVGGSNTNTNSNIDGDDVCDTGDKYDGIH